MTSNSVEAILSEGIPALATAAGVDQGAPWFQKSMPDQPDRALVITVYRTMRHPTICLDGYAAQIRGRGVIDDTLDVDELLAPIADWFAGLTHVDIGPVHINQVLFRVTAPLGTDSANRTERGDTFDLDIDPPATTDRPQ